MDYLDRRGIDPVSMQDENPDAEAEWTARERAKQAQIENFKDYPQSIGELRSDKTQNASDWTPRDTLIDILRRIDNGVNVTGIVISYCVTTDDGDASTHYLASTKHRYEALGLLTRAEWLLNEAHA